MKKLNKILLASLAVALFSCNEDFKNPVDDFVVTSGEADFSNYIAIGNSLTSGYTNNALYISGQENSYPNILAGLMKPAGGGEFKIPFMADEIGGFTTFDIEGKLQLKLINGSLVPVPTAPQSPFTSIAASGPYNNLGIPGIKSYHFEVPGYANLNPYFGRIATSPMQTVSHYIGNLPKDPTFFTLWVGNNDVLAYATSGGVGVDRKGNIDILTYGPNDISDVNVVKASINGLLNTLVTNKKAKGVIANIPSVTSVPYFTTVPAKPISNLPATTVTALNTAYAEYNGGLALAKAGGAITEAEYQARLIKFTAGDVANGAVMIDKDLTDLSGMNIPSFRQTTSKDMIVFTASSILPQGFGTQFPLEDKWVLSEKEIAKAEAAVSSYNTAISELAATYNIALVDTYTEMKKLASASGIRYYGNTYTTTFVSGGTFSLDGVHLTGTGYAIVANMFADAINKKYKSNLRNVFPGNYPGIKIP